MLLGGGEVGISLLWALVEWSRFARLAQLVLLWPDLLNNSLNRYLKHYGNDLIVDPTPQDLRLLGLMPRMEPDTPLRMCGRNLEQARIIKVAHEDYGLPLSRIICQRYDDAYAQELIRTWDIDVLLLAAYGGKIGDKTVEMVGGNVYILHPGFSNDMDADPTLVRKAPKEPKRREKVFLPEHSRGKDIMERIVATSAPQSLKVYLMRAGPGWDDGEVVAMTHEFGGSDFLDREMRPEYLPERVKAALTVISTKFGELARYDLLPQLFTLNELVPYFRNGQLLKMGFPADAVRKARKRFDEKQ